jgi:hypothetical protein
MNTQFIPTGKNRRAHSLQVTVFLRRGDLSMDGIQHSPAELVTNSGELAFSNVSAAAIPPGAYKTSAAQGGQKTIAAQGGQKTIAVITGGSERVPQSSYVEALASKRYLMWAAEAACSRIADIGEGPDGQDRLVLVTAYGGEIHDYGNRIEIPERTADGRRVDELLVDELPEPELVFKTLAVLAARLTIVKGWTRAEIVPHQSAFFVRAIESLVRAGVKLPSNGHAKSDPEVMGAASDWRRPHWNRVQVTDKQRHEWLGALIAKLPEPARRAKGLIPAVGSGDSRRRFTKASGCDSLERSIR